MKLSLTDCQNLFLHYELGVVQTCTRLTKGYTNANYKVRTSDGTYVLRIYLEKQLAQIQYEMRLLAELKKIDFPTAYPLVNREQEFINHTIFGEIVLYAFIEGEEPKPDLQSVQAIAQAAAQLNTLYIPAQLHCTNPMGFPKCQGLIEQFPTAAFSFPDLFHYFEEQTQYLAPAFAEKLPEGLIHGDLFTDNTLFRADKLAAILDFDEACVDRLLIELGVAINGFCYVKDQLDHGLLKHFVKVYQETRPLSDLEKELLPFYMQWGAHTMITWHLQHLIRQPTDPRLRRIQYLVQRVRDLRKEGMMKIE